MIFLKGSACLEKESNGHGNVSDILENMSDSLSLSQIGRWKKVLRSCHVVWERCQKVP